jgi:hypothetical protein
VADAEVKVKFISASSVVTPRILSTAKISAYGYDLVLESHNHTALLIFRSFSISNCEVCRSRLSCRVVRPIATSPTTPSSSLDLKSLLLRFIIYRFTRLSMCFRLTARQHPIRSDALPVCRQSVSVLQAVLRVRHLRYREQLNLVFDYLRDCPILLLVRRGRSRRVAIVRWFDAANPPKAQDEADQNGFGEGCDAHMSSAENSVVVRTTSR